MKKVYIIVLFVLICSMVFAAGAKEATYASDKDYVLAKGKLVVGITDFAPMDYKEGNEWVGFDADLAKAFAKSLGVEVEFIEINWDSKTMELDSKNIDCIWNGMTLTDGVMKAMDTSNAYCNNSQIIVAKPEVANAIKSVEDAKKYQFAVEAGSAGAEVAADKGFKFIEVEAQSDAVMEVAAGTSQACIIDSLMAAAMAGPGTSYPDLVYTMPLTEEKYVVGFRKGSNLVAELNAFLKQCYNDGTMGKIAKTYGTQASIIAQ